MRLDVLGFVLDAIEVFWDEGFRNLKVYKKREGHCRVRGAHVENGFRLGVWVDNQRQLRRRAGMSQERMQRLDELGFDWDPYETDWEEGFRYLMIYKEREGHCSVPALHKEN